jgi:transmembrane sensor
MDSMSRLSDLFPDHNRKRRKKIPIAALAAGIACTAFVGVAAFIGFNLLDWGNRQELTAATSSEDIYETAIGEQSTITLPDGSQLILNTNSLVRTHYTAQNRLVVLERGEVHVLVAEDRSRPLSVIAGRNVVQAVGTEFNVEIVDSQRIELVVTQGLVKVGLRQPSVEESKNQAPARLPTSAITVAAGEALVLGESGEEITKVSADDIEVRLSWRNGNLIFRGESLEEAVKEIGRYTSVEFVFLDDKLKRVRVAGLFKAGDVDGLLAALRENFDIAYERVDDQKVLLDSK